MVRIECESFRYQSPCSRLLRADCSRTVQVVYLKVQIIWHLLWPHARVHIDGGHLGQHWSQHRLAHEWHAGLELESFPRHEGGILDDPVKRRPCCPSSQCTRSALFRDCSLKDRTNLAGRILFRNIDSPRRRTVSTIQDGPRCCDWRNDQSVAAQPVENRVGEAEAVCFVLPVGIDQLDQVAQESREWNGKWNGNVWTAEYSRRRRVRGRCRFRSHTVGSLDRGM